MSNYLSQPGVRRRSVVLTIFAAIAVAAVGCGEGEQPSPEIALPTDPYEALKELRRRTERTSSNNQVRYEKRLNDATSTIYYCEDGSQIRIDSRPEDYSRLTISMTTPRADWLAISFSDGTTKEGGRYIDGAWNTLPGVAERPPLSYHVLLTNNPDSTGLVFWAMGQEVPGASLDTGADMLRQMLTQASQIIAVEPGGRAPTLGQLRQASS